MDVVDLLASVTEAFGRRRLPFVVIGGVAVSAWLPARATEDLDIVVRASKRYVSLLKQALIDSGARPTAVEMRLLFERRFIRLVTAGPKLDVMIALSRHDRTAFDQARTVVRNGKKIRIARPEDLVLYKLQAWRPQDQVDVYALLHAIPDMDRAYLESWLDPIERVSGHPMRVRWEEVLAKPPPVER